MNARSALSSLLLAAALAVPLPLAAEEVASVLGIGIGWHDIARTEDEPVPARRLYVLLWRRLADHYAGQNGLAATEADIAEALAYHRDFDRKDRAQRARKLEELEVRLAADGLTAGERAWLEEFRAVLVRLARRDADSDRLPPPDPAQQGKRLAPRVEMWKVNRSLYERFGGVVALTRHGPDPVGARAALVADYERRGLLTFFDSGLREAVYALLTAPPAVVIAPGEADFTPYWRRPIPPSYFPD